MADMSHAVLVLSQFASMVRQLIINVAIVFTHEEEIIMSVVESRKDIISEQFSKK